MSQLRVSFSRSTVRPGAPAQLGVDMRREEGSSLVVVERRLQGGGGSFPTEADFSHNIFIGASQGFIANLIFEAPPDAGTYKYTVKVIDNVSGKVVLSDDAILFVQGVVASAAVEKNSVDFFAAPYPTLERLTAVRVTFNAEQHGSLVLDWSVRRVFGSRVENIPMRTTRFPMDGFYAGDVEFAFLVSDNPGRYEWEWRVVKEGTNEVLVSQKKVIDVVGQPVAPVAPPPAPALAVQAAPQPDAGVDEGAVLVVIGVAALVGLSLGAVLRG